MKLFLIIDETNFYQPDFVAELIRRSDHEITGAALVTKVSAKNNIEHYMLTHWYYLHMAEMAKLACKKITFRLRDKLAKRSENGRFYSVSSVFEHFKIDFFKVEYNINRKIYLERVREKEPDVIISSNSLLFGEELLHIPKHCINRHSALLPSYGGLWPVFQAVRNNEKKTGVSVHLMAPEIDRGPVLSRAEIPIAAEDTIDSLYRKCFSISASVVLEALERLQSGIRPDVNRYPPSYYSFPSKQHWREFRTRGRRFI